jgi:predicted DNA-binding protein
MEVEFLDRLSEPVRDGKAKSVSAIIRTALEQYDFSDVLVMRPSQLQISVRLPAELTRLLKRTARTKHTSVGHLVRAAVEAYLPEVETAPLPEKPARPARRKRQRVRRK